MGRHENALEIYAYRLHDYLKAEEYVLNPHFPAGYSTYSFLGIVTVSLTHRHPKRPQSFSLSSESIFNRYHLLPNHQQTQACPYLYPQLSFNRRSS